MDMHAPIPEGWPELQIAVHRVSFSEVQRHCPTVMGAADCVLINFVNRTCDIYVAIGDSEAYEEEHGRAHCEGRDHIGSSTLRDAMAKWRAWDAWELRWQEWARARYELGRESTRAARQVDSQDTTP